MNETLAEHHPEDRDERLIGVADAAILLGMDDHTVRFAWRRGDLPKPDHMVRNGEPQWRAWKIWKAADKYAHRKRK